MVLNQSPAAGVIARGGIRSRQATVMEAAHAAKMHNASARAKDYCDFTTLATASAGWYEISVVSYPRCPRLSPAFDRLWEGREGAERSRWHRFGSRFHGNRNSSVRARGPCTRQCRIERVSRPSPVVRTRLLKMLNENHSFDIGNRLQQTTSTEGQPS